MLTLRRTELSETARTFRAYCESDCWPPPRVNRPAWIRIPQAVSRSGDPNRPTGRHDFASERDIVGERIACIDPERTRRR